MNNKIENVKKEVENEGYETRQREQRYKELGELVHKQEKIAFEISYILNLLKVEDIQND